MTNSKDVWLFVALFLMAIPFASLMQVVSSQSLTTTRTLGNLTTFPTPTMVVSNTSSETFETLTVTTGTLQLGRLPLTQIGLLALVLIILYGGIKAMLRIRR